MQRADGRMTVLRKQNDLAYRVAAVEALEK